MKRTRTQLVGQLEKDGLKFSEFTLVHEGNYSPADADWNYKDVPHLHHVHDLVEATIASVSAEEIATINIQKALGMSLPLAVFNYQSTPKTQTYFTTWLFFVLIIETIYEALGPNRTRVSTTYSVGSSKLLTWLHPGIRWTIKRNYKDLMSQDIPMRTRRGQLRSWGYSFRNPEPSSHYGFEATMDISKSNVVPPVNPAGYAPVSIQIEQELPDPSERLIGRDDHLGLRLVRTGNRLSLYPRLCPHEGCSLDQRVLTNDLTKCNWHGRLFGPLATIDLSQPSTHIDLQYHQVALANRTLTIKINEPAPIPQANRV